MALITNPDLGNLHKVDQLIYEAVVRINNELGNWILNSIVFNSKGVFFSLKQGENCLSPSVLLLINLVIRYT